MEDTIFDIRYADSVSPLVKAIIKGDLKETKKLLLRGKLPQATDNRGWTALHYCAALNQVKVLKLILKMKPKSKKHLVNLRTWENLTPLAIALKNQSPSVNLVQVLLKAGANTNLSSHTNLSPLHLACMKKGNIEIVRLLVQHGANVNAQEDISKSTALHLAAADAKDDQVLKYLLELSDLTIENCHGHTAFFETCAANFTEGVRAFLQFDKNLATTKCDIPALVQVCFLGNLEAADLLIKSGANVNGRCKALVKDPSEEGAIILDVENYLPIHSTLNNLQLFQLLLGLTNHEEIKKLNSSYCSFPLFILIYAEDISFYETLLQFDCPEELKVITSQGLTNFFANCSWEITLAERKFRFCFVYNFLLQPEAVIQNFISFVSRNKVEKTLKFLHQLAKMGISSGRHFFHKQHLTVILQEITKEKFCDCEMSMLAESCYTLLMKNVLSLKQLCRRAVRSYVRSLTTSDWLAYKIIRESNLPECLKEFLFFKM